MRSKLIGLLVLVGAANLAGCGGAYILTVPQQVGPAGGEAAVIARVERSEIFLLATPVDKGPVSFTLTGDAASTRAGYTDKLGYAGAVLKMPETPGKYEFVAQIQDSRGASARKYSTVHVLDPREPVAAVDLDSILAGGVEDTSAAADALTKLAADLQLVYLTRKNSAAHADLQASLAKIGLPTGAILTWTHQRWRVSRDGKLNLPRLVFESRMVSQLANLRKALPGLTIGICNSQVAGRAFAEAGMRAVLIGQTSAQIDNSISCGSWDELGKLDL